jgi:hypothetical protein
MVEERLFSVDGPDIEDRLIFVDVRLRRLISAEANVKASSAVGDMYESWETGVTRVLVGELMGDR